MSRLRTHQIDSVGDVKTFFDTLAIDYRDCHGDPGALLRRRLNIIRRLLAGGRRSLLVEIGCGSGMHLFALAGEFERAIGVDVSTKMIETADTTRRDHPASSRISLIAEPAEAMASLPDGGADAVLCVGAFEHMLDKAAVLRECYRILGQGGRFVCLTPNGSFIWYTVLGPMLGLDTRHLSTDRFLTGCEFRELLNRTGFLCGETGCWDFVPKGDMPVWLGGSLSVLDRLGGMLKIESLRGGLFICAEKP